MKTFYSHPLSLNSAGRFLYRGGPEGGFRERVVTTTEKIDKGEKQEAGSDIFDEKKIAQQALSIHKKLTESAFAKNNAEAKAGIESGLSSLLKKYQAEALKPRVKAEKETESIQKRLGDDLKKFAEKYQNAESLGAYQESAQKLARVRNLRNQYTKLQMQMGDALREKSFWQNAEDIKEPFLAQMDAKKKVMDGMVKKLEGEIKSDHPLSNELAALGGSIQVAEESNELVENATEYTMEEALDRTGEAIMNGEYRDNLKSYGIGVLQGTWEGLKAFADPATYKAIWDAAKGTAAFMMGTPDERIAMMEKLVPKLEAAKEKFINAPQEEKARIIGQIVGEVFGTGAGVAGAIKGVRMGGKVALATQKGQALTQRARDMAHTAKQSNFVQAGIGLGQDVAAMARNGVSRIQKNPIGNKIIRGVTVTLEGGKTAARFTAEQANNLKGGAENLGAKIKGGLSEIKNKIFKPKKDPAVKREALKAVRKAKTKAEANASVDQAIQKGVPAKRISQVQRAQENRLRRSIQNQERDLKKLRANPDQPGAAKEAARVQEALDTNLKKAEDLKIDLDKKMAPKPRKKAPTNPKEGPDMSKATEVTKRSKEIAKQTDRKITKLRNKIDDAIREANRGGKLPENHLDNLKELQRLQRKKDGITRKLSPQKEASALFKALPPRAQELINKLSPKVKAGFRDELSLSGKSAPVIIGEMMRAAMKPAAIVAAKKLGSEPESKPKSKPESKKEASEAKPQLNYNIDMGKLNPKALSTKACNLNADNLYKTLSTPGNEHLLKELGITAKPNEDNKTGTKNRAGLRTGREWIVQLQKELQKQAEASLNEQIKAAEGNPKELRRLQKLQKRKIKPDGLLGPRSIQALKNFLARKQEEQKRKEQAAQSTD